MPRILACILLFVASVTMAAPPTELEIRRWIRDLEDPKFKVRTVASAKLKDSGLIAIPHLIKPARDGSPETSDRVMKLLEDFARSQDLVVGETASKVVRELAEGDSPAAVSARQIINRRRHEFLQTMADGGAVIYQIDDRFQYVGFDQVSAENMPRFMKLLAEFPEVESFSARTAAFDDQCADVLATNLPNLLDANLFDSKITNDGLKSIARLTKLMRLPMGQTRVTDAGLKHLSGLKNLTYVGVRGNSITDAGVRELKCHAKLTGLNLGETQVTDAVIKELRAFPNLRTIYLPGTKITDQGLEELAKIKDLEEAWLIKTNTTFEGRSKLKEALPDLRIADDEKDYP